ncbi:cytochrome o ubiquinol oxidase subunit III [Acetobacteraceae bacterium ESL0709]|nr:cytochrome o ubiquinol oxidase subunit III [Acetobacteraceae bacterium ESL0697]MDF7677829.1 cytochrome o ubiquinol oxidase subunit III [Acetobacteraceae bacterium ESL0709]
MSSDTTHSPASGHEGHVDHNDVKVFGFWVYLMTDCVLFGTLFTIFAVMCHQYAGGPTGKELFNITNVGVETAILLVSSITYGFAMINAFAQRKSAVLTWLLVTALLGLSFLVLEVKEFAELIGDGAGPDRSAFLSSFFTLVGTHGLHVTFGLIWMTVLFFQIMGKQGLGERMIGKLTCLSLFWHFLDIVWICVFTFVYLGSVM